MKGGERLAEMGRMVDMKVRRSDEGHEHGEGRMQDPEVRERAVRRRFTTEYKLRILEEADRCGIGEVGALLRREGLYSSHLTNWRHARANGELAQGAKSRQRRRAAERELRQRNVELERENQRLKARLEKAETVIDVQKKLSGLLGINLRGPENGNDG